MRRKKPDAKLKPAGAPASPNLKRQIMNLLLPVEETDRITRHSYTVRYRTPAELAKRLSRSEAEIIEVLYDLRDDGEVTKYTSTSGLTVAWRLLEYDDEWLETYYQEAIRKLNPLTFSKRDAAAESRRSRSKPD